MVGTGEGVVLILCSFVICLCFICTVSICLARTLVSIKSAFNQRASRGAVEGECCYICVDRVADTSNEDQCGHGKMMCGACFETIKHGTDPRCPLCRATLMTCVQIVSE